MPWGWLEAWRPDYREPKIGRPHRGSRKLVKAARKAANGASRRSRR